MCDTMGCPNYMRGTGAECAMHMMADDSTEREYFYDSKVFNQSTVDEAKQIILTFDGRTTQHRWETETPYLLNLIDQELKITSDSLILD